MTDWISRYDSSWLLEWLGPCAGNTFGYTLPIRFSWSSDCGEGINTIAGYGDSGVAALVLDLEVGFTVFHEWLTDVIPCKANNEQRISRNDVARQRIAGKAFLLGNDAREKRALLAEHAASGGAFLMGLPHESLLITDISSTTLTVPSTAMCDWANPGQRVIVGDTTAVVQAVTATTIEVDVAVDGVEIMPAVPVYLEPQQNFPRYPLDAESWDIEARFALLDFAPVLASLALGPITDCSGLEDARVISRIFGLGGNALRFALVSDGGAPSSGLLSESDGDVTFTFKPDVTTVAALATALQASSYEMLAGDWDPLEVLAAGDAFALTLLSGGEDSGEVGRGATLTEYAGRPVWDLEIPADSEVTDGVVSMVAIIDHGGAPYALSRAEQPDFFRALGVSAGSREDWQWFKLFEHTVIGRQKSWWLPTWRNDLTFVSKAVNTIVIADDGDFFTWWPKLRQHIQIEETNGTITYAEITAAVKSGGNVTLTIDATIASSSVEMISWLELCRFETDTFEMRFNGDGFEL